MSRTSLRPLLLTGATGFVGRHVLRAAAQFERELGVEIVAAPGDIDLRDPISARDLVTDVAPQHIAHLAALSFVPDSFSKPWEAFEVNVRGTLNLLEAAAQIKLPGVFLFVSTAEVYGMVPEAALPLREDRAFAPRSPYGVTKAAGEILCQQQAVASNLDVRIARPFNIIGPGQDSRFAVSSFARQIAEMEARGDRAISVGNLDVTRDFVDVRDAVGAILSILRTGKPGKPYNVCSGRETLVGGVLERLVARARIPIEIVVDPARVRPAEQRRVVGSHSALTEDTGWTPAVDLDATLDDILEHWRGAIRL